METQLELVESTEVPRCPCCEQLLSQIEYRMEKFTVRNLAGFSWLIVLMCPHCKKVIGTKDR